MWTKRVELLRGTWPFALAAQLGVVLLTLRLSSRRDGPLSLPLGLLSPGMLVLLLLTQPVPPLLLVLLSLQLFEAPFTVLDVLPDPALPCQQHPHVIGVDLVIDPLAEVA